MILFIHTISDWYQYEKHSKNSFFSDSLSLRWEEGVLHLFNLRNILSDTLKYKVFYELAFSMISFNLKFCIERLFFLPNHNIDNVLIFWT